MNWYEEKQAARKERMEARAERTAAEGKAKYDSGFERLRSIPFGQPMMPDHYSYKRDRNFRAKAVGSIDKGCELMREAEQISARAEAVGTGGISSDDPDAVKKLQAELAALEERQITMKAANDEWRKAGNKAGRQPDGKWVDMPNPGFRLSNNSANIRRIKGRIEVLKRNATRETKTVERADGIRVVQNAEINRLQIFFPGKPEQEVRTKLKSYGFRWSPTEGAWQRQLSNAATWAAEQVIGKVEQ